MSEILFLTEERMWNHCAGVENPADIGSRGEGAARLKSNVLWWERPSWLSEPMRNWPSSEECSETIAEERCVEMKKGQAIEAVGEAVLLTTNGLPIWTQLFRLQILAPVTSCFVLQPWCCALLKEGTLYLGEVTADETGNAEVKLLRSF